MYTTRMIRVGEEEKEQQKLPLYQELYLCHRVSP